jgi:hypothetical protein
MVNLVGMRPWIVGGVEISSEYDVGVKSRLRQVAVRQVVL